MGNKYNRFLEQTLQAQELVLHFTANQGVKSGERLVQKPYVRLHRQGTGDADPLLLSAREFSRVIPLPAAQPYEADYFPCALMPFGSVDPLYFEGKSDVVDDRAVRQKRKMLKYHTHLMAPNLDHFLARGGQQILPLERDLAARRLDKAREAAYKRRFP